MVEMRTALSVLVLALLWFSAPATAQPLGTFRWQILPYCNVITLNIVQQGAIYTLDGTDDRCGTGQVASARGIAFLNPNGTIGIGITMVQPGGVPVHLEATLVAGSFNGTWRDSSGASGNFVLTPGAGIGGPPRQVSASGVPPGSITAIQLASGAVDTPAIAPNAINGTHVLDGSLTVADIRDAPRVLSHEQDVVALVNNVHTTVAEVTVPAPAVGRVLVNASGTFGLTSDTLHEQITCSLTTGTTATSPVSTRVTELTDISIVNIPFGATRVFNVGASSTTTFRLVCLGSNRIGAPMNTLFVRSIVLTALFIQGS